MAASYVKFQVFVEDLAGKVHDLLGTAGAGADTCKVYLSNDAPSVSLDEVKADLPEISTGSGYTGAVSVANVGAASAGIFTLQGTSLTITASGGVVGPFRYVVLFNDTPTSPVDPLIAYWDYGSSISLNDGESFSIKFDSATVGNPGDIFTLE